jgi:polynucleotide 5'-hydroxyl-kinase GRC3/NOL9
MLTMKVRASSEVMKVFPDGVILLDIDPGQPELAAPGIIYLAHVRAPLLGPPFANLIVPDTTENAMLRMHYIGDCTPRESPSHYQKCVADLLSLYSHYESLPLIINTCGWNTGSGKTILHSAVRGMNLTDIIHIGESRDAYLHDLMQPDVGGEQKVLTQIPSQPNKTPLKSGKDFREMQLQSYLHASGVVKSRVMWDPLPATLSHDALPADSGVFNETFMIVMLDHEVKPEYILDALDESVAAIVAIKHDSPLHGVTAGIGEVENEHYTTMRIAHTLDSQLPYLVYGSDAVNPLDPATTECMGLALVTAVFPEKRKVRIKSPVSAAHVRAKVAKGCGIALVLARQQGLWSTMESILAREERSERLQSGSKESIASREREYVESLSASTDAEADPGWTGFFEELEKSGRPQI